MYVRHFIDAYLRPKSKLTHNLALKCCRQNLTNFSPKNEVSCLNWAEICVNEAKLRVNNAFLSLRSPRSSNSRRGRYSWEWGRRADRKRRQKAVKQGQSSVEGTDSYLRQIEALTHISPFWR